ncbi:MAG TPA: TolC family protein, partial [Nitrospiraceae bacterium]|nr:TolC family protein [Nitrospiraceae bacterium]
MSHTGRAVAQCASFVLLALTLPACGWFPAVDLSPTYTPPQYVIPVSWHGSSPFVEANPADSALRPDWWKLYDDPVLNRLVEQAMAVNPDLQAAAERFVQARNVMMKARSQYLPKLGLGFGASNNRISDEKLFRPEG